MSAIKRVQEAIEEIKLGKMVIMLDDEDRENEGDLVYAGSLSDANKVNFMATYAKGLICVAVTSDTAKRLELNPMVASNTSSYETAFTVSVDCAKASTGISAGERDDTIRILSNPISNKVELVRPGHIFPLIAKDGGTLVRTGHTEGSVDLCKLAGLVGEAVICEIMKADGTMARRDDLDVFAQEHNMKQVYISDIIEYRMAYESLVKEISTEEIKFLNVIGQKRIFEDHLQNHHTIIQFGDTNIISLVKFHNVESDLNIFLNDNKLNSMLKSIDFLQKQGGILVFLDNQNNNKDGIKDYGIGAQILRTLGIKDIKLLSSSGKHSFVGINGFGLNIKEEIIL